MLLGQLRPVRQLDLALAGTEPGQRGAEMPHHALAVEPLAHPPLVVRVPGLVAGFDHGMLLPLAAASED